jgi:autotransporter-associated beta strand protein
MKKTILCLAVLAFSAGATLAVDYTWTNGGSDLLWNTTSTNWTTGSGNIIWADSNAAIFGATGAGAITVSGTQVVTGLTTDANGYSLSGGTIDLGAATTTFTINNDISIGSVLGGGTNGLTKAGNGTLTLSNTNTYTGATTISAGSLKLGGSSAIASTSALTVNGGSLDLNGNNFTTSNLAFGNAAGTITDNSAGSGTTTFTSSGGPASGTFAFAINDGANKQVAVNVINNATSTAILGNSNSTFSGGLTITGNNSFQTIIGYSGNGIGTAGNITSSGFGRGTVTIGLTAADRAQVWVRANSTLLNDIVFNSSLGTNVATAIRVSGTNSILAGTLTAGLSDITLGDENVNAAITLQGQLTSSGSNGLWIKNAFNRSLTVTLNNLSGNPNDYAGNTTVDSRHTLRLGASNQLPDGSGKGNLALAGTFNLNGFNETINGLTGAGTVEGGSGTPTFTVGGANANSTFSGTIRNTAGTLSMVKTGNGTLTLSGNNTYTGTTTVSGGTLLLASTGSIASTQIGFGVANASSGLLTVENTSFSFTGTFDLDLLGVSATSGSWTLVNGSAFGAGDLNLADLTSNLAGLTFTNPGSLGVWSGTDLTSRTWTFNEDIGQLTVIPEPSTWAFLLVTALAVIVVRNRRRRA